MELPQAVQKWGGGLALELLKAPAANPKQAAPHQQAAAEIVQAIHLHNDATTAALLKVLGNAKAVPAARTAAAKALASISATGLIPMLSRIVGEATEAPAVRDQGAQILADANTAETRVALAAAVSQAQQSMQVRLALAMAAKPEGAEALLQTIASGKASARLLQISAITDRLAAAKVANLDERIASLTKGLAPITQELQGLIDARQKGYKPAEGWGEKG